MIDEIPKPSRPVVRARPAAPYVGGKRRLAATLAALIDDTPHTTYAEPFVGMGGVFLARRRAPPVEVVNDISTDVVTFFRVLQRHFPAFVAELDYRFTSRAEFERLTDTKPETLTDIERSVRFLYLQRLAFGGKIAGRTFGVSPQTAGRFDATKLREALPVLAERLAGVVIERMGWAAFLDAYDRPETLFYLDPPYFGSHDYYGRGLFPLAEFGRLAHRLAAVQGRFILSLNDAPEVRALFAGFAIADVDIIYSVDGKSPVRRRELIVSGGASGPIAPLRPQQTLF